MWLFAAILYVLLVIVLYISAFVLASTIILGFGLMLFGNIVSKIQLGRYPHPAWNICAVIVTASATAWLWVDIFNDTIDFGRLPMLILGLFDFVSVILYAVALQEHKHRATPTAAPPPTYQPQIPRYVRLPQAPLPGIDPDLEKLRSNLFITTDVFQRYGITFQCNLMKNYDTLVLNFELYHTRTIVDVLGIDAEIQMKITAYDTRGNLLLVEEAWVDYDQLKQGYAADAVDLGISQLTQTAYMKIHVFVSDEPDDEEYYYDE